VPPLSSSICAKRSDMSLRTAGGISTFSPVIFDLVWIRPQG
jgi:hypothetical protein